MSDGTFSPTGVRWQGAGYGVVEFGRDDQMVVIFYNKAVRNDFKSKDLGRPVFEDVDYVKIFAPGERLNQIDRPVKEDDKQRWPRQWNDFIQKRTQVPDGTPIDLLFPNFPSVAENLKANGIYTVEQCANLSAHGIDSVGMGGQEYVNKAKAYLKSAEKGQGFNKLQGELNDAKQQVRLLQRQISEQKKQIDSLINRQMNPALHSNSPPWVPGYDAQVDRINATHVTQELKPKRMGRKPKTEVEDTNQLDQIED